MNQLLLDAIFKIEADIEVPLQVNEGKAIFNVPSGKLIDHKTNDVIGELVTHSRLKSNHQGR